MHLINELHIYMESLNSSLFLNEAYSDGYIDIPFGLSSTTTFDDKNDWAGMHSVFLTIECKNSLVCFLGV